jgi:hypothetical protein
MVMTFGPAGPTPCWYAGVLGTIGFVAAGTVGFVVMGDCEEGCLAGRLVSGGLLVCAAITVVITVAKCVFQNSCQKEEDENRPLVYSGL